MNTPKNLLSPLTRAAVALGVVAAVSATWMQAGHSSHEAVALATSAMARTYVTLPTVEIVARREAGQAVTALAAQRAGAI